MSRPPPSPTPSPYPPLSVFIRGVTPYGPGGGGVPSPKSAKKREFLEQLAQYFATRHDPEQELAWVGDINVAPRADDVFDAEEMEGEVCFHPAEREALERIRQWGFHDQFRKCEQRSGFYSGWDYRAATFRRNRGLRIDLIWASEPLSRRSVSCWMDREERVRGRAAPGSRRPASGAHSRPSDQA